MRETAVEHTNTNNAQHLPHSNIPLCLGRVGWVGAGRHGTLQGMSSAGTCARERRESVCGWKGGGGRARMPKEVYVDVEKEMAICKNEER